MSLETYVPILIFMIVALAFGCVLLAVLSKEDLIAQFLAA